MAKQAKSDSISASAGSSTGNKIPVAIVDDESGIRLMIKVVLQKSRKFRFAAEFDSGDALVRGWSEQLAPIVLMDLRMPGTSAIECIRRLKSGDQTVKVILISGYLDSESLREAYSVGADGFLSKPVEAEKLVGALEFCLSGGIPLDAELRSRMGALMDDDPTHHVGDPNLTDTQNSIMRALAEAKSYERIAEEQDMSLSNVKRHINQIYKIYGVHKVTSAVQLWRHGGRRM